MPPKRFACSPRRFSPLTSLDDVPETSPLTTQDGHTHSYHLHRDKLTLTPNLNVSSGVFPFGCVRDATLIPMQTAPQARTSLDSKEKEYGMQTGNAPAFKQGLLWRTLMRVGLDTWRLDIGG